MGILALQVARAVAVIAFMGVSTWLAFWHHKDGLQPVFLAALSVPLVVGAWLGYLIRARTGGRE